MNPLLAKVKLPGRLFQLPSKGIFYKPGVLAPHVFDAEVHVQPLSGLAEMKLRSPDMLFNGRAIREICEECIPDILNPDALISKDIDAIFCYLRIVTYGSEMDIKSVHDCQGSKVHDYRVNVESIVIEANNTMLDRADVLYSADLSNGQKIKLKPITFKAAIDITQLQHACEKSMVANGTPDSYLIDKTIISDLMAVIESVDGISDVDLIEEWLRSLQKKYWNEIIAASQQANGWGYNLDVKLKCRDCGVEYQHNLELNPVNFFSE